MCKLSEQGHVERQQLCKSNVRVLDTIRNAKAGSPWKDLVSFFAL